MINKDFTSILKSFKNRLLKANESEDDIQDYETEDDDTENDDAAQFLQEEDKKETPQKSRSSYREWEPHDEYTDEQQEQMDQHMDDGYTHREAELFANAGKDPSDFISALNSRVKPSQPSDKHLSFLKEAAAHLVQKKKKYDLENADREKQPLKFAAGQANKAHDDVSKDFKSAYDEFLKGDDVKDLKGGARTKAVRQWKKDWHDQNPDHDKNLAGIDHGKAFREAGAVGGGPAGAEVGKGRKGIMGQNINDRIDAIAGVGGGSGSSNMSAEEAAQHVGGVNTDAGTQANMIKDPLAGGAIHPKQRKLAQEDRMARAEQAMKQHGNPEQVERFSKLKAARSIIRRPKGSGEQ